MASSRVTRFDWNCVLVLTPTIAFLVLGCQDWLFDSLGSIDSFQYVGLFSHFGDLAPGLTGYKVSRLPWVLPGFLLYKVFPPIAAHYALQIGFNAALHLLIYLSIRGLFSPAVALVSTMIYATNPWLQGPEMSASGGWNYHNTAALTCYFASTFCMVNGLGRSRRAWLWLAGASAACCIFTTVFMAPFQLVTIAGLVLALAWPISFPAIRQIAIRMMAGAMAATLLLGAMNVSISGGRFWFFVPEWRYTLSMARENIWFRPFPDYVQTAYWLACPAAVVLATISIWTLHRGILRDATPREQRTALAIHAIFLVSAALVILLSTALRQSVAQFSFMVLPLAGPMTLAIAAFLYLSERSRHVRLGFLASAAVVAAMIAVRVAVGDAGVRSSTAPLANALGALASRSIVWSIVCAMVPLVFQVVFGGRRVVLAVTAMLFAAANAVWAPSSLGVARNRACCLNRDAFEAFVEANRFVTEVNRSLFSNARSASYANRAILSDQEYAGSAGCGDIFMSQLYVSIAYGSFYQRIDPDGLAGFARWTDAELAAVSRIALFVGEENHESFADEIVAKAGDRGIELRLVARRRIVRGPFAFWVVVLGHASPRPIDDAVGPRDERDDAGRRVSAYARRQAGHDPGPGSGTPFPAGGSPCREPIL